MNVTDAVNTRKSIRAFLDTPVADELVAELLTKAARAPSGGNLQPWRISVINGATMPRFLSFLADTDIEDTPAYDIYPRDLKSPYRDARFKAGEDMYELLGNPARRQACALCASSPQLQFFRRAGRLVLLR